MVPEITPEGLTLSPGGRPTALNVPGSASVAVTDSPEMTAPSLLVWLPGLLMIGGDVSFTSQVNVVLAVWLPSAAVTLTLKRPSAGSPMVPEIRPELSMLRPGGSPVAVNVLAPWAWICRLTDWSSSLTWLPGLVMTGG